MAGISGTQRCLATLAKGLPVTALAAAADRTFLAGRFHVDLVLYRYAPQDSNLSEHPHIHEYLFSVSRRPA